MALFLCILFNHINPFTELVRTVTLISITAEISSEIWLFFPNWGVSKQLFLCHSDRTLSPLSLRSCHQIYLCEQRGKLTWKVPEMKGLVCYLFVFIKFIKWLANIKSYSNYSRAAMQRLTILLFWAIMLCPWLSYALQLVISTHLDISDSYHCIPFCF